MPDFPFFSVDSNDSMISPATLGAQNFWHLPAGEALLERGYKADEPEPSIVPPGGGAFPVAHFTEFAQVVNLISRTYRYTWDEAQRHSYTNAMAIWRDPVIFDAIRARQMPTAQLAWHLDPCDETNTEQADAAKITTEIVEYIPRFQQLKMDLLNALWYGRSGVQMIYAWDRSHGDRRMVVTDHQQINGDKLVFRFSGQPGVLVHTAYGRDSVPTDRGRAHFFTARERQQLIIHKHEPEDADFLQGDRAGAIHGVGLRSRVYWMWWLRNQVLTWLMDYLERIGAGGIMVFFYDAGNKDSKDQVAAAATKQWRNNAFLFPRYRDAKEGGPGVMHIDASNAGAGLLQTLVTDYFDAQIRRLILGQTLSSETGATGMGSGVAESHMTTLTRIIKYDAVNLEETLTADLIRVIYAYMWPGMPHARFRFDVDMPDAESLAEKCKAYFEMGGDIGSHQLAKALGIPLPEPGEPVLSQLQGMQPAGVGSMPQGVGQVQPAGPPGSTPPGASPTAPSSQETPSVLSRDGQPVRLMNDETFRAAIEANPHDPSVHNVYADWLEEQDRGDEALSHRLNAIGSRHGLRQYDVSQAYSPISTHAAAISPQSHLDIADLLHNTKARPGDVNLANEHRLAGLRKFLHGNGPVLSELSAMVPERTGTYHVHIVPGADGPRWVPMPERGVHTYSEVSERMPHWEMTHDLENGVRAIRHGQPDSYSYYLATGPRGRVFTVLRPDGTYQLTNAQSRAVRQAINREVPAKVSMKGGKLVVKDATGVERPYAEGMSVPGHGVHVGADWLADKYREQIRDMAWPRPVRTVPTTDEFGNVSETPTPQQND